MILVEILDGTVNSRSFTSNGKEVQFFEQTAFVHLGDHYPAKFSISLQKNQSAYPPGEYVLSPASLRVGNYGSLEFQRNIILEPLKN
ncbi:MULTISPECIES: single-stranded DNA-binding protein [Klebsiella]|uniref:Single-stranded DNA-binding protein n=1 Tax=Klebsiella quasipneumoniae TaxID=1463165 RepID=A0A8H9ZZ20_9ENTR|nr:MULTISPECIES: single-stranded DNA-binding protein [Klebsiella]MBC5049080.1 V protein [Klebsiella quasipneumoniae]UNX76628.1 G5P family DNA-binding protein [Klebsiella aerogenes]